MPKGIKGFQKGHKVFAGSEKGRFDSKRARKFGFKKGHPNTYGFQVGHKDYSTKESREKISCQLREEKSYAWKGENAGYGAKHDWVRRYYGHPIECEDCGKIGRLTGKIRPTWNIHWSNCDHKYKRVREDYNGRCQICHIKYDRENNLN